MDTSETYVKMCDMAEEIQKQQKDDDQNYLADIRESTIGPVIRVIWLPRQDQLQEMIDTGRGPMVLLKYMEFILFKPEHKKYFLRFSSFEQLWLAFVMKEKYGKTWNDEDWIEKNEKDDRPHTGPNIKKASNS